MKHKLQIILFSFFLIPFLVLSQNDPAANQKNKASNFRNRVMPNQSAQMQHNHNDDFLEDRNQSRNGQVRQTSSYQNMPNREAIIHARQNNTHHVAKNEGNLDARTLAIRDQIRKQNNITASNHEGNADARTLAIRDQIRKQNNITSSNHEGNLDARTLAIRDQIRKQNNITSSNHEGNLAAGTLEARSMMRKQQSFATSNYSGDILSRTLAQRNQRTRSKSHEMATYQGDIIVHGRQKGQHPSAVYRGGKIKNSYAAKEKYRKRMLKKYGRQTDVERPEEKKESKPRYDRNEADIWNK